LLMTWVMADNSALRGFMILIFEVMNNWFVAFTRELRNQKERNSKLNKIIL
jgi:hypothetical protein